MNEHEQRELDLMDARGRAAATRLKVALARVERDVPEAKDLPVARRNRWLAAAAVLVVVGLVAAFLALRDGRENPNVVSNGGEPGAYLVPGWLPEGWDLGTADELRLERTKFGETGEIVVYGDGGLDDPWAGPLLSVTRGNYPSNFYGTHESLTVDGHPAQLYDEGDEVALTWTTADEMKITVVGNGMARDAVVAAADEATVDSARTAELLAQIPKFLESADVAELTEGFDDAADGPSIAATGRPAGFVEIARGPAPPTPGAMEFGTVTLVYGPAADWTSHSISIAQVPGDQDDVDRLRLPQNWQGDPAVPFEPTMVRGRAGFSRQGEVQTFDGGSQGIGSMIRWFEPSTAMVVTVTGGPDDDVATLRRIAESLHRQTEPLVERAIAEYGPFGPLDDDEFLVAEGTHNGDRWRVVASSAGGSWMLNVESFHNGEGFGRDQGDADPDDIMVATAEARVGDDILVYGNVTPDATEVVVQRPDGSETPLDLYDVDLPGWPWKAFVGLLPKETIAGAGLIARDDSGNVVLDGADELLDTAFRPRHRPRLRLVT